MSACHAGYLIESYLRSFRENVRFKIVVIYEAIIHEYRIAYKERLELLSP